GILKEYTDWYSKQLENCKTLLIFDDYQSTLFNVSEGVNQGYPLSLLGFIFYNTDVLQVADPNPHRGELSLGFIDNIALAATGGSYEKANGKLVNMMEKNSGTLYWSREHNTEFKQDKTAFI
ncbi:hypothetical protein BDR06DRAFT_837018, partial [Suillus hirtellus]